MKNILSLGRIGYSVLLCSVLAIACQKQISNEELSAPGQKAASPTSLRLYLTDHQTPIFDSVFIDIRRLEVKLEDDSLANDGWISLPIHPGVYNILRFRNGLDTLFGSISLPAAPIRKLRLTLGAQNSATAGGQSFPLLIKSGHNVVTVNITSDNFDVSGGQVHLWLDFDAGGSIKINNSGSGNNNGFELDPHISLFGRHNTGRIEGRVLPLAAHPIVKAFIGSDTATAIPDREGEFKIVGLRQGTYGVIIDGQNNYNDTTINNVRVGSGEDTHLPVIVLHL